MGKQNLENIQKVIDGKKVVVVMPAYNAEKTLMETYQGIPSQVVDEVVLVDDHSMDNTVELAHKLGISHILTHSKNLGYGANQKTCYKKAIELNADIIIMLHADYQYDPIKISNMATMITRQECDVVLASRMSGKSALDKGMPIYKYIANKLLTRIQNIVTQQQLTEYHTGYRAFTRQALLSVNIAHYSDDFVFDNQILLEMTSKNFRFGEVFCPAKYFDEASSINLPNSIKYGIAVLIETLKFYLAKKKVIKHRFYTN